MRRNFLIVTVQAIKESCVEMFIVSISRTRYTNLRKELRKRNLDSRGAKTVLINHLRNALINKVNDPEEFDFPDPVEELITEWIAKLRAANGRTIPNEMTIENNTEMDLDNKPEERKMCLIIPATARQDPDIILPAYLSTTATHVISATHVLTMMHVISATHVIFVTHVITATNVISATHVITAMHVIIVTHLLSKTTMKILNIFEKLTATKTWKLLICSNNDLNATLTNCSTFDDELDKTLIWESINLEINDVSEDDSNANASIHTEHRLATDDVFDFEKTLPVLAWNECLILVYLDDDINDGFIADEDEFFIAVSVIERKDVSDKSYNMHPRYPSGHSTPRKHNRKILLALSANKIKKGPGRLPMTRETETGEMRYDLKKITQELEVRNYKIINKINDVIYKTCGHRKNGQR
ncbi:hypothetical protein HELRODRAFT_179113 [Helobdella robusta]|uniref:SAP domain-containing protein n=1 Tax=Helobdella robusta TaxID=6412 RepID=T1FE64_HELRO|nr:hypothetical protein HELRODRAFT_179113 [Helobdella robusta]ESN95643.1 hypothetical protein HELRODRAFT_179113 [Helobdella robusta]